MSEDRPSGFTKTFTAGPEHIDELGHVNNAVWVQWIQDLATAHWEAAARPEDHERYIWVVVRHEIDYRGNIAEGEVALGETFIPDNPKGATCPRAALFTEANGKALVSALTTWALVERTTQRLARVRPELMAPFRKEA
ncbi:MAG: acyl-CoA thioesterase [Pseudomonadota bacterium]